MKRSMRRSEKGAALPLALLIMLLVTVLGVTLFSLGLTEVAIGTNWRAYSAAFYAAEAGVEYGVVQLRQLLTTTTNPTDDQLKAISAPPTFLATKNVTFTTFEITRPLAAYQTTFTTGPYAGLTGLVTDYQVRAAAQGEGGTRATVTQVVRTAMVPLFQFGVFYGKAVDLEIWPGPAMTFNGKIFSNSNIYIGAGTSLQIQSDDPAKDRAMLRTAGRIYRTVKREVTEFSTEINPLTGTYDPKTYTYGATSPGVSPQIANASGTLKDLNFDAIYKPGGSGKWASPDEWVAQASKTFGDASGSNPTVADGSMGVGQITPMIPELFLNPKNPDKVSHQMIEMPQAGDSKELAQAKLYSQAGLRIIDGVATDKDGKAVTLPSGTVTTKSFWDAREKKTVNVWEVDVDKLASSSVAPKNGVVYVASTAAPTSDTMPGVRLTNGGKLPRNGLTVVSQNPVYVKGDYNKDSWGKKGPKGEDVYPPAAILADAITVLSGNWDDSKGKMTAGNRGANDTIVNAAFGLGPSHESATNDGNGQLENLIRFLEDWDGKELKYKGSLVALWHSQQATGKWRCCSATDPNHYYRPPKRTWSYDSNFNTTPPPGTPMAVLPPVKGRWSQE
jgi:hypothetical protein